MECSMEEKWDLRENKSLRKQKPKKKNAKQNKNKNKKSCHAFEGEISGY
jgi:hypothetical protein